MVRDELITSRGELRESKEELRATKDDLCDKTTLLNGARREAFEAASSAERLTEECSGLRGEWRPPSTSNTSCSAGRGYRKTEGRGLYSMGF